MRSYEAMVIVDAALEEGDIQKAIDRFLEAITTGGGEVTGVDRWGNRRFAYEIAHKHEGYYFVTNFRAEQSLVDVLKRTLQISDEFVRGKIVRPELAGAKEG
ncbi:MAG TPA: 30S ribosomal protein S6 [Actinomycetota bacterium]|nr:30S ribosomal protein S6 [Actinomycetota bacterium]